MIITRKHKLFNSFNKMTIGLIPSNSMSSSRNFMGHLTDKLTILIIWIMFFTLFFSPDVLPLPPCNSANEFYMLYFFD